MKDWTEVFESYPQAEQIFVVDDMPFTERGHADSHARATGHTVVVVARPVPADDLAVEEGGEPLKDSKKGGKKALLTAALLLAFFVVTPTWAQVVQDSTATGGGGLGNFIKTNWLALLAGLIALAEVVVRLTPSDRDNSIVNFIKSLLDAIIPNRRTTGGSHV